MKHIYAVTDASQAIWLSSKQAQLQPRLDSFLNYLTSQFAVSSLPRCILWTDRETATKLLSDISIPAYTNDFRTVFCPDIQAWREIYLHQLDGMDDAVIRAYYETQLAEDHLLQILGHEFVHHSDFFPDSDYEGEIWFEEGMCEYISRKFFLTEQQFREEACINERLVQLLQQKYGHHPLDDFGAATYLRDYAGIFYDYWRSFLAVNKIVQQHNGNIPAVFEKYHKWTDTKDAPSLYQWFAL